MSVVLHMGDAAFKHTRCILEAALLAGIMSVGAEAVTLGVVPTPAVAYLVKRENVTRIEYSHLWYAYRREFEGEYFTYFSLEEPEIIGVVGVAEENNQFMVISMPKKKEEGNE